MKIDMVIPWVDNKDPLWQKIFTEFCERNNLRQKLLDMRSCRYQDNVQLINYQLKLINKNMPWIDTIYLLLMNQGQEPKDLPSNVKIIYHGAFIPKKHLPTFNSCTIEMFLWNIPNLSEHFIYANDDMLPLKPLKPSDFFTEEGKIKITWWKECILELATMFRQQCYNSYILMAKRTNQKVDRYMYIRPEHSFTPMIKSHAKQTYELGEDYITAHIRAFRTEYQVNQYIYPIFEHFVYGTEKGELDFAYTQLDGDIDTNHDIVCFNIVPKDKERELVERLTKLCK